MSQTETETVPAATAEKAGVSAPARGAFRRLVDWYTCRLERENVRRTQSISPRELELLQRARAAYAAGNLVREPSDPARNAFAAAHAATFYAEALTWALWSTRPDAEQTSPDELWEADSPLARELGVSAEQTAEIAELLRVPRLGVLLADRSDDERANAAALLKRAALVAINVRERPLRIADGLLLVATARIALTVLLLGLVVGVVVAFRPQKVNVAAGKPWKVSSSAFECHPDQGECGGAKTRILFHTKEEQDPWFEYDLGAPTAFSSLRIDNRQDGEGARAVPLIAEVGDDGQHFRQVARREDEFSTWSPSFPSVTARYVRLRVPRRSMLHLEEVDVYR